MRANERTCRDPYCNHPGACPANAYGWRSRTTDPLGTIHLTREPTATYHAGPWENLSPWPTSCGATTLDKLCRENMRARRMGWARGFPWGCADAKPWEF